MGEPVAGRCRVVCFSPRHDLTIARMSQEELRGVVDAWTGEMQSLEKLAWVRHVQIFENRGALMGASNPHPHCQIWAASAIPNIPQRELESFEDYRNRKNRCLLCDYLKLEMEEKERIVCENEGFVAMVPFWAVWPYETMIVSKRHVASLLDFTAEEKYLFGSMLGRLTTRYDNLFETDFPYSAGLHQRPSGGGDYSAWHFHGALSAAAVALCHGAEVHGGIRTAVHAATGHHAGTGRDAPGGAFRDALSGPALRAELQSSAQVEDPRCKSGTWGTRRADHSGLWGTHDLLPAANDPALGTQKKREAPSGCEGASLLSIFSTQRQANPRSGAGKFHLQADCELARSSCSTRARMRSSQARRAVSSSSSVPHS